MKRSIKNMNVTQIQFVKCDEEALEYSGNIVLDDSLVVQLSGNIDEAHKLYVPASDECFYENPELQDRFSSDHNIDEIEARLSELGIENNYYFLLENATEVLKILK